MRDAAAGAHALRTGTGAAEAVQQLDAATRDAPRIPHATLRVANLMVARLYESLGNHAAALRAVRRHVILPQLRLYAAIRHREEGRLAERVGDRDAAMRAWSDYLHMRASADPGLAPQVAEAREALQRLRGDRGS